MWVREDLGMCELGISRSTWHRPIGVQEVVDEVTFHNWIVDLLEVLVLIFESLGVESVVVL